MIGPAGRKRESGPSEALQLVNRIRSHAPAPPTSPIGKRRGKHTRRQPAALVTVTRTRTLHPPRTRTRPSIGQRALVSRSTTVESTVRRMWPVDSCGVTGRGVLARAPWLETRSRLGQPIREALRSTAREARPGTQNSTQKCAQGQVAAICLSRPVCTCTGAHCAQQRGRTAHWPGWGTYVTRGGGEP